jgi:hypothetical protein
MAWDLAVTCECACSFLQQLAQLASSLKLQMKQWFEQQCTSLRLVGMHGPARCP